MNEKAFDLKNFIVQVVGDAIEGANKVFSFNDEEMASYKVLLTRFIDTNSSDTSTSKKGNSLEEIVAYIIEKSVVFETIQNVRTSSNEIDHLVRLNQMGNVFKSQGLLSFEDKFLAECKNYDGSISVTWVGKFFSLMTYTKNHLGIIFSFHGLSGPNWRNAEGCRRQVDFYTFCSFPFYTSAEKMLFRFFIR
jgi:hypothetical protein